MPGPHALLGSGSWPRFFIKCMAVLTYNDTAVQDEGLKKLLMSWYYAGYYTGLYEGEQKGKASS